MTDISNYCAACECDLPHQCPCTHTCWDNDAARDASGEQPSDPRYETYMQKNIVSPTPRWDIAGHPDVAIHMAIADLAVQVARIANVLEYQVNIDPSSFPCTDNDRLGLHGREGRTS